MKPLEVILTLLLGLGLATAGWRDWQSTRRDRPGTPAYDFLRPVGKGGPRMGEAEFHFRETGLVADRSAQQASFAADWHVASFQAPWQVLSHHWTFLEPFFRTVSFSLIGLVLGVGIVSIFSLRRKGYAVLTLFLMALLISSTNYHDFTRYSITVVPIFPVLGQIADELPILEKPALVFSTMLLTLFTALLVNGYHIN